MIATTLYLAGILFLSCPDSVQKHSGHTCIKNSQHNSLNSDNRMRKALRKKSLIKEISKYSSQVENEDKSMHIYGLLEEVRKYGDSSIYGNALSMVWESNGGWKNKDGVCIRNCAQFWQMMIENDTQALEMIVKHMHTGLGMSTPPEVTLRECIAIDSIVRWRMSQRFSLKLPPLKDPLFYKACK